MAFAVQARQSPNARDPALDQTVPGAGARTNSDIISGNLLVA